MQWKHWPFQVVATSLRVTRLLTCPLQSSLRHMGFCHSSINLKAHVVKMELVKSLTYNFSSLVPATLWEY